ncbi:MAG: DUF4340 domain-containing protein [Acidobacteria bacterium]|nr:DUF4340 domain-containing protein [Acidobacteriota bacterium]
MNQAVRTSLYAAAAAAAAITAAMVEPERATPGILSDQGEVFYPAFRDPQAVRYIEVVDYDESTATARPFQVAFEKGRWVLPSHSNYPVDIGDRLNKSAGALIDLKKDLAASDSLQDHGRFGVIDPMDAKVAQLTGRGKRVTLRDARKEVLADFILGKPVENKPGYRYIRVPGAKRVYSVQTSADPSARFADWVNSGLVRVASANIRRIVIRNYSLNEQLGRLENLEQIQLSRENGQWKMAGAESFQENAVKTMAATLDGLRIVDVKPKPPSLAEDLRSGRMQLTLETAMSLRQRGFFIAPNGMLLANEGEMHVETDNGISYGLRFGEIAGSGDAKPAAGAGENRFLLVTATFDAGRAQKYGDDPAQGERVAKELVNRFADWYYVISGADFSKLRLRRSDLVK